MENNILVTYASKYGSTAEIAEKIGEILNQSNMRTDVLPVKQINDIASYNVVILGSALYVGQWPKEASKFIQSNETSLSQKKVWLFISGPTGEGDPKELVQGWHIPISLRPIVDRINPRDIAVFHGNVDLNKLNFIEKMMIKQVKTPSGDFRDWKVINTWATSIANELLK